MVGLIRSIAEPGFGHKGQEASLFSNLVPPGLPVVGSLHCCSAPTSLGIWLFLSMAFSLPGV